MPRQVSLLLCWDVFVCRTCLGHNYLVEEKLKFKRGEDVLEEVHKFCYLGDMISCYCGVSEAVSARVGVQGVKWCINGKQFIFEAMGEDLPVLCSTSFVYCCETWELTIADEVRLHAMEHRMIRIICGVRLVDRMSTDILWNKVGVVKTKDMIIQSRLW